jgi:hypothetical protein
MAAKTKKKIIECWAVVNDDGDFSIGKSRSEARRIVAKVSKLGNAFHVRKAKLTIEL